MPFAFLILAVLCFSVQFIFSKCYQLETESGIPQTLIFTTLMSLGIILEFSVAKGFSFSLTPVSVLFAFLYALFVIVCEVATLVAFRQGTVSIVTLFALIGSVVLPFFYGVLLLRESVTNFKITAVLLMLISFGLSLFEKKPQKNEDQKPRANRRVLFVVLCMIVFLSNGMVSVLLKAHQRCSRIVPEMDFLAIASFFSLILSLAFFVLIQKKAGASRRRVSIKPKSIVFAFGFALCNGTGNLFSLFSANSLPSSVQFPMISGGVVALTAVLSTAIYKEKFTALNYISIILTILSVVIFSFG